MRDYVKLNEDRQSHVKNDYIKPSTHEELEDVRKNPISAALTVGKEALIEWFEKANGKKVLGSTCGGRQQGPIFTAKGYDVTIMDLSASQLQRDNMAVEREGLETNAVQADMTKPFPFEDKNFDIIFNPVSNVYIEDLEDMYQEASRVLKKGGPLIVGFMNLWVYIYDTDIVWDKPDEELCLRFSTPLNPKELEEEGEISISPEYGYKFNHTLETQTRGQLKNGLAMIDFYEPCDKRNRLSRYGSDYIATLCIKP